MAYSLRIKKQETERKCRVGSHHSMVCMAGFIIETGCTDKKKH